METRPTKFVGRFQLRYRGTECLNCGHPLDLNDKYCPHCAQANSTKKLTLRDFVEEFFNSLIDYDSRLLKTVSVLLWRPGRISLDFIAGRRMRYANPFRFLLSLAIVYFLLISISGNLSELDRFDLNRSMTEAPEGQLNLDLNLDGFDNPEAAEALKQLDSVDLGKAINDARRKKDSTILADPKGFIEGVEGSYVGRVGEKANAFMKLIDKDSLYTFGDAIDRYGLESNRENRLGFQTAASLKRVMRQPGTFLRDLVERLPFATFFFLPFFTLFIWLVYIRKKYTYTDNLVFSFHIQSLFFILLIIGFLVNSLIGLNVYWLCFTAFATYLFVAMRRFYKQGVFKTIIKYLFLNTIFVILATLAAIALLLGSAFTY